MRDRQRERRSGNLGAEKIERVEGLRHRHTESAALSGAPVRNLHLCTLSRRLTGCRGWGARPGPPSRFPVHSEPPTRPTRVQTQEPSCRDRQASCSRHSATGARRLPSPAWAPLQGRRGAPWVTGTDRLRLPILSPARRVRSAPGSARGAPIGCGRALTWTVPAWRRACRPPRRVRSW